MSFMDRDMVPGEQLRESRRARLLRATLRRADQTEAPVMVRNISERGLGISCRANAPWVGEAISITLPGSPALAGVVRWSRGANYGIELEMPINPDHFAEAASKAIAQQYDMQWSVKSLHRVPAPRSIGKPRPI